MEVHYKIQSSTVTFRVVFLPWLIQLGVVCSMELQELAKSSTLGTSPVQGP